MIVGQSECNDVCGDKCVRERYGVNRTSHEIYEILGLNIKLFSPTNTTNNQLYETRIPILKELGSNSPFVPTASS